MFVRIKNKGNLIKKVSKEIVMGFKRLLWYHCQNNITVINIKACKCKYKKHKCIKNNPMNQSVKEK